MFYPHADDENVAMGYANYNNHIQENDTMVTIDPKAFRTYMIDNYIARLDRPALLDLLEAHIDLDVLVNMSRDVFNLPFDLEPSGSVVMTDVNELLRAHSDAGNLPEEDCFGCGEEEEDDDYDIITNDDDWRDEEFAPYDELDENLEEQEDEEE